MSSERGVHFRLAAQGKGTVDAVPDDLGQTEGWSPARRLAQR